MTLNDFLTRLPQLTDRYVWYADDLGMLRAHIPGCAGLEHSPLTALAEAQTGIFYDLRVTRELAALALDLSLESAMQIVSAEDRDSHHDPALAQALRLAVGIGRPTEVAP